MTSAVERNVATRALALSSAIARLLALCAVFGLGCSNAVPTRFVVERDLGAFFYRRYQKTLDVEFVIPGNPAAGHTATYVRRGTEPLEFATAFVTVYERAASLSAEVAARLAKLERYERRVQELAGQPAWLLSRGDERWALWVSGRHLVKLGAPPGEAVPEDLADAYMDAYPSDLDEHGRARPDAQSRGPTREQIAQQQADAAAQHPSKGARPAQPLPPHR